MPSIVRKPDGDDDGEEHATSSQSKINMQSTVQNDITKEQSTKRKGNNITNFFTKRRKSMYISTSSKLRYTVPVEPTPIPIKKNGKSETI